MNVIAPPEYEGPEDELSVIAACLSAWPSCYRMGEHDTNVCRKASAALVEIGQLTKIAEIADGIQSLHPGKDGGLGQWKELREALDAWKLPTKNSHPNAE